MPFYNFTSRLKRACCQRPYHVEQTGSRLITAVKQRWAWLVLGWVTAWELHVLLVFFFQRSEFFSYMRKLYRGLYNIFLLNYI